MISSVGPWRCLILLIALQSLVWGQVVNVQRCIDPQCQGVISEGRTVLKYHANSNSMLSFGNGQPVRILSKGDGNQQDIWGVEINGKRGFANRRHLQETRIYSRNLGYVAPPHASYYEIQLGGPEADAHQQQQQPQAQPTVPPPAQAMHDQHPHDHPHQDHHLHHQKPQQQVPPQQNQNDQVTQQQQVKQEQQVQQDPQEQPQQVQEQVQQQPQQVQEQVQQQPQQVQEQVQQQPPQQQVPVPEQAKAEPQVQEATEAPKVEETEAPKEEPKEEVATEQPEDEIPATTEQPVEAVNEPVVENVEPVQEPQPTEVVQEEPEKDVLPETVDEMVQVLQDETLSSGESNTDIKDAVDKVLATASLTSIAGAHATQVNASPEDMEFNRIKSTYANVQGEFVLDHNVVASPTLSSMSTSVMSSVDYEIIDGTKIYNDGRFEIVQDQVVEPTKTLKDPEQMMTAQPELSNIQATSQDAPDIQSSVVEVNNLPESNNDSINVQPTEELNDEMFKSEAPEEHISTTMASSLMPEAKEVQQDESSNHEQLEQIQITDAPVEPATQTLDDTEEDDDEDDEHEPEQDLEKNKAFVQEQLDNEVEDQEEVEQDLERNKAFVQEQLEQHVQEQEHVQEAVEEAPEEPKEEVTEVPTEDASTESPGFFSGLFANEENQPEPMGTEAPENIEVSKNNEPEPMVTEAPTDPYVASEDPYAATQNYEASDVVTPNYETPSDEIKFYEPGQAPDHYDNQDPYLVDATQAPPVMSPELPPMEPETVSEAPADNPQDFQQESFYQQQPEDNMQLPEQDLPQEYHHDTDQHYQEFQQEQATQTQPESPGVVDETVLHYVEYAKLFVPEWLHKTLHWGSVDGVSPTMAFLLFIWGFFLVLTYFIYLMMSKSSNEAPLKAKLAAQDKELFKARNELLVLKRELDEGKHQAVNSTSNIEPKQIIKEVAPKKLLAELDSLKHENFNLYNEKEALQSQMSQLSASNSQLENQVATMDDLKNQLYQAQQELAEAESMVQECVEEKKKVNNVNTNELVKAIDLLRDQLNSQKEAVHKYEGKIKRREAELKEKTQELRKLRADSANAKLQVDKISVERDSLKVKVDSLEAMEQELTDQNSELQVQLSILEAVRGDLTAAKEKLDEKEEELEAVNSEMAVLNETINGLKMALNNGKTTKTDNNGFESGDGWDVEDEIDIPESESSETNGNGGASYEAICDVARLRVDLQKAQSACEQLSEQLMAAEAAKEKYETEAKSFKDEAELARKAKETAMEEKGEMTKKHQVLSAYFNQREAELQKQLGLQTQRLGEVEVDSESVSKKLNLLYEELDSYKAQCKSLKLEMEEQERSLKAQNAQLEKKQHESWVTVRQESRKLTEAQNEMQTLRTRLTVAESKLAEKHVEIEKIMEENRAMKETMDRINNHQILKPEASSKTKVVSFAPDTDLSNNNGEDSNHVYANGGNGDLPSISSSGPGSITDELPPELPPLPFLPIMNPAPPPMSMMYPADNRPAPLGRRSPPHGGRGRYSRSPSPPPAYGSNRRGSYHRDVSPTPSDRSDRSSRYASSSYDYDDGRYSPPYPPRHRRRHSRDDRSPDRYSSRSERSDYEYRDTPPRDGHGRRRNSRTEANSTSGAGDYDYDYQRTGHRDKRSERVKDRHGGPKTSSPMM